LNDPDYEFSWTSFPVAVNYSRDCAEIKYGAPYSGSGIYSIDIAGQIVAVYCDMTTSGGGWTVFQRRIDGSEIFYRSWTNYALGFGRLDGEFWIGNDNLAALTSSKQYRLRVDLGDWEGNYRYAEYSNFNVGGASSTYILTSLGVYSGDAGDSLTYHRFMMFTTYDMDNDRWTTGNCAVNRRGAWWYDNCEASNLNGEYNNTVFQGIHWGGWMGIHYSLRFTEMKIRPA